MFLFVVLLPALLRSGSALALIAALALREDEDHDQRHEQNRQQHERQRQRVSRGPVLAPFVDQRRRDVAKRRDGAVAGDIAAEVERDSVEGIERSRAAARAQRGV